MRQNNWATGLRTDTPLTELGHDQARRLSGRFHRVMAPDASPLQRAHHTARAIAAPLGLEARLEPRPILSSVHGVDR